MRVPLLDFDAAAIGTISGASIPHYNPLAKVNESKYECVFCSAPLSRLPTMVGLSFGFPLKAPKQRHPPGKNDTPVLTIAHVTKLFGESKALAVAKQSFCLVILCIQMGKETESPETTLTGTPNPSWITGRRSTLKDISSDLR